MSKSHKRHAVELRLLNKAEEGQAIQTLCERIASLLKRLGPSEADEVRNRLCIASQRKFDRALQELMRQRSVERIGGTNGSFLRLRGDTRRISMSDAQALTHIRRLERAWGSFGSLSMGTR